MRDLIVTSVIVREPRSFDMSHIQSLMYALPLASVLVGISCKFHSVVILLMKVYVKLLLFTLLVTTMLHRLVFPTSKLEAL